VARARGQKEREKEEDEEDSRTVSPPQGELGREKSGRNTINEWVDIGCSLHYSLPSRKITWPSLPSDSVRCD